MCSQDIEDQALYCINDSSELKLYFETNIPTWANKSFSQHTICESIIQHFILNNLIDQTNQNILICNKEFEKFFRVTHFHKLQTWRYISPHLICISR